MDYQSHYDYTFDGEPIDDEHDPLALLIAEEEEQADE